MGAIISRFRKEKTTYQVLENLEEKIKSIETYTLSTQEKQKRIVGNFLVISIGIYVVAFLVFYFAFFPPTWAERITYSTPLLIFPLLILFIKQIVAWFFTRKVNSNSGKLSDLRAEKKKIIEQCMDKETYKVALEIINRFGDKTTPIRPQLTTAPTPRHISSSTPTSQLALITPKLNSRQQIMNTPRSHNMAPPIITVRNSTPTNTARSEFFNQNSPRTPQTATTNLRNQVDRYGIVQRQRTPFPIIDQNKKGVLEKMVDFLIGDGPNSLFAMICKECYGHNGMVVKEEYEYAAFKCAYCNAFNPSKKVRPTAPRLASQLETAAIKSDSSTSSSEKDSGSDTDGGVETIKSPAVAGTELETKTEDKLVDEKKND